MSNATPSAMTVEAFLAWERGQGLRHEFDGTRIVAMTGETPNHSRIAANPVRALERRLKAPCEAWRGDVKILAANSVRYPDVAPWSFPGRSSMGFVDPDRRRDIDPSGNRGGDSVVRVYANADLDSGETED